jgi:hypothetical protein
VAQLALARGLPGPEPTKVLGLVLHNPVPPGQPTEVGRSGTHMWLAERCG